MIKLVLAQWFKLDKNRIVHGLVNQLTLSKWE